MKIGYVGDSKREEYKSGRTFRLASYTPEKFKETSLLNIEGLAQNIHYSFREGLLFYRIRSDIIPFASHRVCTENWQKIFAERFNEIGTFIKDKGMRISMHPDQFVVINSTNPNTVKNSIAELQYHTDMFVLMGLGKNHKLQIHVGGVFGNKKEAINRFISTYTTLPEEIRQHLVIENDDRLFTVVDCYSIYREIGIPIIFDNLHHKLNNNGESMIDAMNLAFSTWKKDDGIPMIDYSLQQEGQRVGRHADSISIKEFKKFIEQTEGLDYDIMLEIKDKDNSAIKALPFIR